MGSGKTSCCRFLAAHDDLRIIDGDTEAKKIMLRDKNIHESLAVSFGTDIFHDGALSFETLGSIVFRNGELLRRFNRIVHPVLLRELRGIICDQPGDVVVFDAALTPLWKIDSWFDMRIWIDASFETRLVRVLNKGLALGEQEIRRRMRLQMELFDAPCGGDNWSRIDNENGISEACDAFFSLIHKSVYGFEYGLQGERHANK